MADAIQTIVSAKATIASLASALDTVASHDVEVALELASVAIRDLVAARAAIAEAKIVAMLSESDSVDCLTLGSTSPVTIEGWRDADGRTHPHPALDPTIPVNRTELEWWEALDELVECLPVGAVRVG